MLLVKGVSIVVSICIAFIIAGCAGNPVAKPDKPVSSTGNPLVDGFNAQLALVAVEEYRAGAAVTKQERSDMIERAIPVIKVMLPKLPEGYAIQITGHTDALGGAQSKPNMTLSSKKSQLVFDELKKKGFTSPRLVNKGVGGTMLSPACGDKEPCQRRVTFIVVKK